MKQKGFTLIELVVVIIILGILAVTALPKFVNLQGEARASTLQGMKAALEGAATLSYSKAAIQGKDTAAAACITISGTSATCAGATAADGTAGELNVVYGYPAAATINLQKVLETTFGAAATDTNDWWASTAGTTVTIRPKGVAAPVAPATADCRVNYVQSTGAGSRPAISVLSDGC